MALNLYNLKPATGSRKKRKRVGRGDASGHGTYSTRGLKGQKARSGGKGGLRLKGLKSTIQNIPKMGGFKSLRPKLEVVNLEDLEKNFAANEVITRAGLIEKKIIKSAKSGIKILGNGKLTKKFIVKADKFSQTAKEAIEKAGGKAIALAQNKPAEIKKKEK